MKIIPTIILSIALFAASMTIKAQTPTPSVVVGLTQTARLSYRVPNPGDTIYFYSYKDERYPSLSQRSSAYFTGGVKTIDSLYLAFKKALAADDQAKASFALGGNTINLTTNKLPGMNYIFIAFTRGTEDNGEAIIYEESIDKLFGKN